MAVSITIRNVPETTRDELAARAARSGRSLQEYLRMELIEMANQPSIEAWLDRVQHRVETTGTVLTADQILEYRDSGRR